MCHSIANTLHFDAYKKAMADENKSKKILDRLMEAARKFREAGKVSEDFISDHNYGIMEEGISDTWGKLKLRAKQYVYSIWVQYEDWEDNVHAGVGRRKINALRPFGKEGFLQRWLEDSKLGKPADVLKMLNRLSKLDAKHIKDENDENLLEEPLTRFSDLSSLEAVDPEMIFIEWKEKKIFLKISKERNPCTGKAPNDVCNENVDGDGKKTSSFHCRAGIDGKLACLWNGSTGADPCIKGNIKKTCPEVSNKTLKFRCIKAAIGSTQLVCNATLNTIALKKRSKSLLLGLKYDNKIPEEDKEKDTSAQSDKVPEEDKEKDTSAQSDKVPEEDKEKDTTPQTDAILLQTGDEEEDKVKAKRPDKKVPWPPKFTHQRALLQLSKYAWHGVNRVYKYRLVSMNAEQEWNQMFLRALEWIRAGLDERYKEELEEIKTDERKRKLYYKTISFDSKEQLHRTGMLWKMGILGDIERETEGEPVWITELCDRQLGAQLMYNELYSTSNTGEFAYMNKAEVRTVSAGLEENAEACKIQTSLTIVDDSLPDAMNWYDTLPDERKKQNHYAKNESKRSKLIEGHSMNENHIYRTGCKDFKYGSSLLPVSWNRSYQWLRAFKKLDIDAEVATSGLEEEKLERTKTYKKIEEKIISTVNQIHREGRENFARGLYFSNRISIGKIIDRYWSRVDPRDKNFQKKLSQKEEEPYRWLRESLWKCTECWGTLTDRLRVFNAEAPIQEIGFPGPITRFATTAADLEQDPDKDATDSGPIATATVQGPAMLLQDENSEKKKIEPEKNKRSWEELRQLKVRYSFDYIVGYWLMNRLSDRVSISEVLLPLKSDIFLPYRYVQRVILDMADSQNKDWDSSMIYRQNNKFIEDFNNQMTIDAFDDNLEKWRHHWFYALEIDTEIRYWEKNFAKFKTTLGIVGHGNSKLSSSDFSKSGNYIEWYFISRITGESVLNHDNTLKPIAKSTFPIFGTHMALYDYHLCKIALWQKLHSFTQGLSFQGLSNSAGYGKLSVILNRDLGFREYNYTIPFPSMQEIDLFMDQSLGYVLKDLQKVNDEFRNQVKSHIKNLKEKAGGTAIPLFLSNSKNIMQKTDSDALGEIQKRIRLKYEDTRDFEEIQTREKQKRLRDGFPLKEILEEEQLQNIQLETFFSIFHITSERENAFYRTAQFYIPIFKEQIKSFPNLQKQMILLQTAIGEDRVKTAKDCFGTTNDTTILGIQLNCKKILKQLSQMLNKQFKDTSKVRELFKLKGPILMVQRFLSNPSSGTEIISRRILQLLLFLNLDLEKRAEINMYESEEDKFESEFLHTMNPQRTPLKLFYRDGKLYKKPEICFKEHTIGGKGYETEKINVEVECNNASGKQRQTDQEIFDALVEQLKIYVDDLKRKKIAEGLMDDMNHKLSLSKKEMADLKAKLLEFETAERKRRDQSVSVFVDKDEATFEEEDSEERRQQQTDRKNFQAREEKKDLEEWNNKLGLGDENDSELREKFHDLLEQKVKKDFRQTYRTAKDVQNALDNEYEDKPLFGEGAAEAKAAGVGTADKGAEEVIEDKK